MRVDQHYFITCENDAELKQVNDALLEKNIDASYYPIGKTEAGEGIVLVEVLGNIAGEKVLAAVKEDLGL